MHTTNRAFANYVPSLDSSHGYPAISSQRPAIGPTSINTPLYPLEANNTIHSTARTDVDSTYNSYGLNKYPIINNQVPNTNPAYGNFHSFPIGANSATIPNTGAAVDYPSNPHGLFENDSIVNQQPAPSQPKNYNDARKQPKTYQLEQYLRSQLQRLSPTLTAKAFIGGLAAIGKFGDASRAEQVSNKGYLVVYTVQLV